MRRHLRKLTEEGNNNKCKQKLVGQQSRLPSNHGDNHVEYTKVKRKHGNKINKEHNPSTSLLFKFINTNYAHRVYR